MENKLKVIHEYFGKELQDSKFYEECGELLNAYDSGKVKDIIEEKADVFIMAYQHYLTDEKVREKVEEKIKRTLERIKYGYYEVE